MTLIARFAQCGKMEGLLYWKYSVLLSLSRVTLTFIDHALYAKKNRHAYGNWRLGSSQ